LEADDKDYPDICDLEVVEDANRPDPIDGDNHNVNGLFGMAYDIMELLLRSHAPPPVVSG
jgi:hypothetical protein